MLNIEHVDDQHTHKQTGVYAASIDKQQLSNVGWRVNRRRSVPLSIWAV